MLPSVSIDHSQYIKLKGFGENIVEIVIFWFSILFGTCFILFFTLHPHSGFIEHGVRQIPT